MLKTHKNETSKDTILSYTRARTGKKKNKKLKTTRMNIRIKQMRRLSSQ